MIKILFVCHGNICRSPMAEFILKDMVEKQGLTDCFEIASAATSTEEIWGGRGNPIYPRAAQELERHHIPYDRRRARQTTREDYGKFDYLIGMEGVNIRNMLRIYGGDPERKIYRLLDFTTRGGDIDDPWYSGEFGTVYRQIREGCEALLKHLEQKGLGR